MAGHHISGVSPQHIGIFCNGIAVILPLIGVGFIRTHVPADTRDFFLSQGDDTCQHADGLFAVVTEDRIGSIAIMIPCRHKINHISVIKLVLICLTDIMQESDQIWRTWIGPFQTELFC